MCIQSSPHQLLAVLCSSATDCTIAVVTITYSKVLLTESAEGFHVFWFCILTSTAAGKWQHTATGSSGFMRSPFYILQQNLIRTSGFRKCHHARLRRCATAATGVQGGLRSTRRHGVAPPPRGMRHGAIVWSFNMLRLLLHSGAFHSNFSSLLRALRC